jgi:hypothetical protein
MKMEENMKKINYLLIFIFIFAFVANSINALDVNGLYDLLEKNEKVIEIHSGLSEQEIEMRINDFISNDNTVLFVRTDDTDNNPERQELLRDNISRRRVIAGSWSGNLVGTSVFKSVNGAPGQTLRLSITNTIQNSITASLGLTNNVINVTVGFNITATESVTSESSITVPRTHNGRAVRSLTLNAFPIFRQRSFSVQYDDGWGWFTSRTAIARQQRGFVFRHVYNH